MNGNSLLMPDSVVQSPAAPAARPFEGVQQDAPAQVHRVARKISGEARILAELDLLRALAIRCDQAGEVDQLAYHLSAASVRSKEPKLLLFEDPNGSPYAAVLLVEYRAGILPTGIFVSLDFTGHRTVLAPAPLRSAVSIAAANHLLRRGALLVLTSVEDAEFDPVLNAPKSLVQKRHYRSAILQRSSADIWKLGADFDETLKTIGHDTRRNFRRHPRSLEASYGAIFVPKADITEGDFLELNRQSSHPVPDAVARWRHGAPRRFPDARLAGIRTSDGKWLSIIGLRSRSGLTDVDWQMNLTSVKGVSLVTAMRSFLLRDELERGTHSLRFDHGTTHSMQAGFREHSIGHLLLTHRVVSPTVLHRLARRFLPVDNSLLAVLKDPDTVWQKRRRSA